MMAHAVSRAVMKTVAAIGALAAMLPSIVAAGGGSCPPPMAVLAKDQTGKPD